MYSPSDGEIARVMAETGMGHIQARNHLISRWILRTRMARESVIKAAAPQQEVFTEEVKAIADVAIMKASGFLA